MYYQYQFEKKARENRRKALIITMIFHLLLVSLLFYGNGKSGIDLLPTLIKETLGWSTDNSDEMVIDEVKP